MIGFPEGAIRYQWPPALKIPSPFASPADVSVTLTARKAKVQLGGDSVSDLYPLRGQVHQSQKRFAAGPSILRGRGVCGHGQYCARRDCGHR